MKTLLVELEGSDRTTFEAMLRARGHEVWICRQQEALQALQGGSFSLVVAGAGLPGRDGWEFFGRMRAVDGDHPTFLLALTGATHTAVIERVLEAGADDYVRHTEDSQELALRLAIIERRIAEKARNGEATFYDLATGLPNRRLLLERLKRSLQLCQRVPDYRFAVITLGMDRFKVIYDSLGHGATEQLLQQVARRLEASMRSSDMIARLGGDEFAVLVDDVGAATSVIHTASRMQEVFRSPFQVKDREIFATASAGIAWGDAGSQEPEDLVRDAHTALYRAKSLGQGRCEVFHKSMHEHAVRILQIDSSLHRALERRELALYYQPVVSLESGELAGFEALLRWHHPDCGLILPDDFIPVAEETGLIVSIGEWVLGEAAGQLVQWHETLPPTQRPAVSVNLSARQFAQPNLLEQIEEVLVKTGLPPQYLCLEITESVVMNHAEYTVDLLYRLKDLGVRLHMDDFGTGYSSLSYLHRFPIDVLKIDRSFVGQMVGGGEEYEIVQTIVQLARTLGKSATAEGVETDEQLQLLRSMGCPYAQGNRFSRPVDATKAQGLLTSWRMW